MSSFFIQKNISCVKTKKRILNQEFLSIFLENILQTKKIYSIWTTTEGIFSYFILETKCKYSLALRYTALIWSLSTTEDLFGKLNFSHSKQINGAQLKLKKWLFWDFQLTLKCQINVPTRLLGRCKFGATTT